MFCSRKANWKRFLLFSWSKTVIQIVRPEKTTSVPFHKVMTLMIIWELLGRFHVALSRVISQVTVSVLLPLNRHVFLFFLIYINPKKCCGNQLMIQVLFLFYQYYIIITLGLFTLCLCVFVCIILCFSINSNFSISTNGWLRLKFSFFNLSFPSWGVYNFILYVTIHLKRIPASCRGFLGFAATFLNLSTVFLAIIPQLKYSPGISSKISAT